MDGIKISKETQELLNKLIEDAYKKLPNIHTFIGSETHIKGIYKNSKYKIHFKKVFLDKEGYVWKVKEIETT